jgi:hypothetical protein
MSLSDDVGGKILLARHFAKPQSEKRARSNFRQDYQRLFIVLVRIVWTDVCLDCVDCTVGAFPID